LAGGLLPDLLQAFAARQGMTLVRESERGGRPVYSFLRPETEPAARFNVTPGRPDDGFLTLLNGEVDMALSLRRGPAHVL
jgi:hypothetical protein